MDGSLTGEFRVGAPRAGLVLLGVAAASMAPQRLARVQMFPFIGIVLWWGLLIAAVVWAGRKVAIDGRGVRNVRMFIEWGHITGAKCSFGFIRFALEKGTLDLPDSDRVRRAILAYAPPDHPVRAVLGHGRAPRFTPLNLVAGLLVLVMLGIALFDARVALKNYSRMSDINRSYAAHTDKFERDARLAGLLDVFRPPFNGADAAPFLSPRVRWSIPGTKAEPADARREAGTAARLPEGCEKWSEKACLDGALSRPADLSWMQELSKYAYWDLFTIGPASAALGKLAPDDDDGLLNIPEPVWDDVVLAARVRFARAAGSEELPRVVDETRHLARLTYSTERFSGAAAALFILRTETLLRQKLGRSAAERNMPAVIPDHELAAAGRALAAYEAFFSPLAPRSARTRIFSDSQLHFARCQGIAGGLRSNIIMRPILETPLLFARDYRVDYASLNQILDSSRTECRLLDQRRQWSFTSTHSQEPSAFVRLSGESLADPTPRFDMANGL